MRTSCRSPPKADMKSLHAAVTIILATAFALVTPSAIGATGFETVLNDSHTMFFIVLNIILTLFFIFVRFDRFAVVHGPEILTTVGIFGCFYGIALALLNFDATKVSASVPQLLEGVKTAFWASVSGVGGALLVRARHYLQKSPIPQTSGVPKAATLDDLVAATNSLQRSLSGNEDGSLLSQLKLMRQEQTDQLRELNNSFTSFAEKMKEDGSKALIEALKEVIADFNAKINEQFGENFKQLNAAVEKLVLWQQQYKDELDKMQTVQRSAAEDLQRSAQAFANASAQTEPFTKAASDLVRLLEALTNQYKLIEDSQKSLSALLGEMKSVTPQFVHKFEDLLASLRTGVGEVQSEVSSAVKSLSAQVQATNGELRQTLVESMKQSQKQVGDGLTENMTSIRQAVVALDKGLQEELTKSLQTLGRQLASLSEKFVADYTPLTDRLREVVRLAAQNRGQ